MRKNSTWAFAQYLFWGYASGTEQLPPWRNGTATTTLTSASSIIVTTSTPFGNTSTSVAFPATSIPFGNTTSVSLPPTQTLSNTGPPPRPTDPFGITPPLPPVPFRGFKNAAYFTNWGINSGFHAQELPVSELTHVLYAFADMDLDGTVKSSDPVIDLEKRYPEDSKSNSTHDAYGAVKQLYIHKKYNRNLKTLISVGGKFSPKFASVAATEDSRYKFAISSVKLVTDWGFDGIDVDWEYPSNDIDKVNFVKLLEECRHEFDKYSLLNGIKYRFSISVASPASPGNYEKLDLAAMNKYVDSWHLMAYDYSGSWDTVSNHQANVFTDTSNAKSRLSTDDALLYYESQGIHPQKVVVGLPLYGRAFEGTSGLGQNYSSVGENPYRDLPKPGAKEIYDDVAKATYSYDATIREFISYDNVRSATYKSKYLKWRHLGGAFFWEASGDKAGAKSLINTMSKNLGWLDETRNNLHYPTSQYGNIRRGVPDE